MRVSRMSVNGHEEFVVATEQGEWVPVSSFGVEANDSAALIAAAGAIRGHLVHGWAVPSTVEGLLCPLVRPSKIIVIGLNYMDHVRETGATVPERPVVFAKYPSALNGPFDDVVIEPEMTSEGDYEAELGVVIGQRVRKVSEEDALGAVFGYAVVNDVSARDWQRREAFPDRSKGFDTFCPVGPWITTTDDVANPQNLGIRSMVNGEVRQDSTTGEMIFPVAALVSYLSQSMTLEPGDLILTGTPHGVGFAMDPPQFLTAGDVVRCEIEGLGYLENRISAGPAGG